MTNKGLSNLQNSRILICIALSATIFAAYWQVSAHDFVNFDDTTYVAANKAIAQGVTIDGIRWAFTSVYASNWHPLTWISHMADISFFGMKPGMHHLTSVVFHILNSILLFLLLNMMTGMQWRSALVAGLFALHPLHVESVAWISERKDVLSTFFWMLTMIAYVLFLKQRTILRYIAVISSFILGLLSKPMLVTLPFVLLLLDIWPLQRVEFLQRHTSGASVGKGRATRDGRMTSISLLILEKIPLLVLALISSGVTLYAQKAGGAMQPLEHLRFGTRILNSILAYGAYLWKMVWPVGLSVFYPYPDKFQPAMLILSSAFLVFVSAVVVAFIRKKPYLLVGWFWFLGTLLPVIGIIQVGAQSMADRYTYIPLIGIFIMIAWGIGDLVERWHHGAVVFAAASAVILALCAGMTWAQVGIWKNSITLFSHALDVTSHNDLAHFNLGHAYKDKGDLKGAIIQYKATLKISPNDVPALSSLGVALAAEGKAGDAEGYFIQALRINPGYIPALGNLANIDLRRGDTDEALKLYHRALLLDPRSEEVHNNLGIAYIQKGSIRTALQYFQEAVRLDPAYQDALMNLGKAQALLSKAQSDITDTEKLIVAHPNDPQLHMRMAALRTLVGDTGNAIASYQKVLAIQPDSVQALNNLVNIYMSRHDYLKAQETLFALKKLKPEDPNVYYNIACMYAVRNMPDESVSSLKLAIGKGFRNKQAILTDPDLAGIRDTEFVRKLLAE